MVVASRFLIWKCQARLLEEGNGAVLARFFSQLAASGAAQAQSSPRVLRSLGKQSLVLSHFQSQVMAIRRRIEVHRWDAKLERNLRSSAIPLSDGLIVEVIKSLSEAKLALRFFIWITQQQHHHLCLSSNAISVLSRRWARQTHFNEFLRTLNLFRDQPHSMTPEAFHMLITGYGWAGMDEKAIETLKSMQSLGMAPIASHYQCVLNILEHEKRFDSVPQICEQMQKAGHFPNAEFCNKLISGLCVAGKKEAALVLLEQMKAKGLSGSLDAYRITLSMFSKADQNQEVLRIFNELLDDGHAPDSKACNALIKALCKDGKPCEAFEVLEMMLERDLNPNFVSITLIGNGIFDMGHIDKVLELWEKLTEKSIPAVTFQDRLVSELCTLGRLGEVEKIFVELGKKNLKASKGSYEDFISGSCEAKNFEKAQEILSEMVEKRGHTDAEVCSVLVNNLHRKEERGGTGAMSL